MGVNNRTFDPDRSGLPCPWLGCLQRVHAKSSPLRLSFGQQHAAPPASEGAYLHCRQGTPLIFVLAKHIGNKTVVIVIEILVKILIVVITG